MADADFIHYTTGGSEKYEEEEEEAMGRGETLKSWCARRRRA
jgi:hypothetical protein